MWLKLVMQDLNQPLPDVGPALIDDDYDGVFDAV